MPTHDYDVSNADGATVRADINSVLDAIVELNSSASAPSTTFAYMYWADTTNGVLKQRDSSNTSWIVRATLSDDRVVAKTTTYVPVLGDFGKLFLGSDAGGSFSFNLLAAATAGDGFTVGFKKTNSSSNTVTIDANGSETVDGSLTYILSNQYDSVVLRCDGANWHVVNESDANALSSNTDTTLKAGFAATTDDDGTKSSGTYTPTTAGGNFKTAVNGGAHTLAPQSEVSTIIIQYTNNASAGAITTSGFDTVTGDSFTTTNGDDFMCYLTVIGTFQHLHVVALQ